MDKYHLGLVTTEREKWYYLVIMTSLFDSQYLSYFNELGLYFKKIEDRFLIDKL